MIAIVFIVIVIVFIVLACTDCAKGPDYESGMEPAMEYNGMVIAYAISITGVRAKTCEYPLARARARAVAKRMPYAFVVQAVMQRMCNGIPSDFGSKMVRDLHRVR